MEIMFQASVAKYQTHVKNLDRENRMLVSEMKKLECQVRVSSHLFVLNRCSCIHSITRESSKLKETFFCPQNPSAVMSSQDLSYRVAKVTAIYCGYWAAVLLIG